MPKAIHIWCIKGGAFTGFKARSISNKKSGPESLAMGYSSSAPIPQSSCPVYLRSIVATNAESNAISMSRNEFSKDMHAKCIPNTQTFIPAPSRYT